VYGDERCAEPVSQYTEFMPDVEPYHAGQFWRRELPPLLAVLALTGPLHLLIIDGYVDLDGEGRPGLGARLQAKTGYAVIGIAKTSFRGADHAAHVLRGRSTRPLLVTAIGLSLAEATDLVQAMAGANRLPIAVSAVDRLCRGAGQGYER
jgi:deoxyribonuclease V